MQVTHPPSSSVMRAEACESLCAKHLTVRHPYRSGGNSQP